MNDLDAIEARTVTALPSVPELRQDALSLLAELRRLRERVAEVEAEGDRLDDANEALTERNSELEFRIAQQALAPSEGRRRVAAERARQVEAEGYSPEHDDEHSIMELWDAACSYTFSDPDAWPWEPESFKPTTRERDLEKAGALFLAVAEFATRRAVAAGEQIDALLDTPQAHGIAQKWCDECGDCVCTVTPTTELDPVTELPITLCDETGCPLHDTPHSQEAGQ